MYLIELDVDTPVQIEITERAITTVLGSHIVIVNEITQDDLDGVDEGLIEVLVDIKNKKRYIDGIWMNIPIKDKLSQFFEGE